MCFEVTMSDCGRIVVKTWLKHFSHSEQFNVVIIESLKGVFEAV